LADERIVCDDLEVVNALGGECDSNDPEAKLLPEDASPQSMLDFKLDPDESLAVEF
jgi:hypothetical protein